MKKVYGFIFAFVFVISLIVLPYVLISYVARTQFTGDYKYIFPNYSDVNSVGEPNSICSKNIYDLDYFGFLWGGINNILNINRKDTVPIHAAVVNGDDIFIFSFREMKFVPVVRRTQVYGEIYSCGSV